MSLKLERLVAKQGKEIAELRRAVIAQTKLVQDLLDGTTGLEAVFTNKIREMVENELQIEVDYEITREALEALKFGGILKE